MQRLSVLAALATILICSVAAQTYPKSFMWGTATASYQVEGAWNVSGRGLSIWDTFSHTPGKVANNQNGDVADDFYHRYENDLQLLKDMGFKYFRLSISWSRILPTGRGQVNQAGIDFYNRVIDASLRLGIEPLVTLFHWDLPQGLEDEYLGFLGPKIAEDFAAFADVCFRAFGDRVKLWLTMNEPLTVCNLGYQSGVNAPGRCSDRSRCSAGNSTSEPWICAHNLLRAHALAVSLYRAKYQRPQNGRISITLNSDWSEPLSSHPADIEAAERHMLFMLGWYADPVNFGDYPQVLKDRLGSLLPEFTAAEKRMLKGSTDFFGLNHYTSVYVAEANSTDPFDFEDIIQTRYKNGVPIGVVADSDWLWVVPWGIQKLLVWVSDRYGHPEIVITENGCDAPKESSMPVKEALNDVFRVNYFSGYLDNVEAAIKRGVNVGGYFAWSLMDNFEWADGYSKRFGIHYVDYNNGLTRYPKESSRFLAKYAVSHTQK